MVNNIVNEILNSANPQLSFNELLNKIPNGQNLWQQFQQYGSDGKQAFMNSASQTGKQNLAQQIIQKLGLG